MNKSNQKHWMYLPLEEDIDKERIIVVDGEEVLCVKTIIRNVISDDGYDMFKRERRIRHSIFKKYILKEPNMRFYKKFFVDVEDDGETKRFYTVFDGEEMTLIQAE